LLLTFSRVRCFIINTTYMVASRVQCFIINTTYMVAQFFISIS